jgi:hypothetical protein
MAQFAHRPLKHEPQSLLAWELVSPRLGDWRLDPKASDTAIGLGLQYVALDRERLYGAAGNGSFGLLRGYLADFAYGQRVSQRDFWRFHEILHNEFRAPNWLMPKGRASQPAPAAQDEFSLFGIVGLMRTVSARARNAVFEIFLDLARQANGGRDVSVFEIQTAISAELRKQVRIRCLSLSGSAAQTAPSTQEWVHRFVLWTGISPPMGVTLLVAPPMSLMSGESRDYQRSHPVRHRRDLLDWRAAPCDGQGRPSSRPSSARRPHLGRCERLRRAVGAGRGPLHRAGDRQVGTELRLVRQRT